MNKYITNKQKLKEKEKKLQMVSSLTKKRQRDCRLITRIEVKDLFDFLGERTIEYYIANGLIEGGRRYFRSDRNKYWEENYIKDELRAINFLTVYDISLEDIKLIAKLTNFQLGDFCNKMFKVFNTVWSIRYSYKNNAPTHFMNDFNNTYMFVHNYCDFMLNRNFDKRN